MFISSYATYVNTSTTDRASKPKINTKSSEIFSTVVKNTTPVQAYSPKNFPVDYISNYKSLNNQQKLEQQVNGKETSKMDMRDLKGAKVAYISNTSMFSLVLKPKHSLNTSNNISDIYPENIRALKEDTLKNKMVNTYLENDMYYQVTA